ncbi:hypothetical protein BGY98DRAFT_1004437 [Russula aff. rugulosa BPL654]|nr:hypothetical protein BGY98DRAFT_1004437 [Russula aff. rugulosa BPL654]
MLETNNAFVALRKRVEGYKYIDFFFIAVGIENCYVTMITGISGVYVGGWSSLCMGNIFSKNGGCWW